MSNKDIIRNQLKALITSENEGDSKTADEIFIRQIYSNYRIIWDRRN